MQYTILATDGGAHPPEKWAVVTAEHIFPISNDIEASRFIEARKVQLAIIEALLPHHSNTMTREQEKLAASNARFDEPHDPENLVDATVDAVVRCVRGTPWASKADDPAWLKTVGDIICEHLATVQDIERQWHAHRNPDNTHGRRYLSRRTTDGHGHIGGAN